jgi:hypothetical protein
MLHAALVPPRSSSGNWEHSDVYPQTAFTSAEQLGAHAHLLHWRRLVADARAGDAAGDDDAGNAAVNACTADAAGNDHTADSPGGGAGCATAARRAGDAAERRGADRHRSASHGGSAEAAPGATRPARCSRAHGDTAAAGTGTDTHPGAGADSAHGADDHAEYDNRRSGGCAHIISAAAVA